MSAIHKSALVHFSADAMRELVADIESYPEFLPWCRSSKVLSRVDNVVEAELDIAWSGLNKSFATRNTLTKLGSINMQLISGPFRNLDGVWQFLPLREDASKISLELEFEFSSKLNQLAFGAVFNQICNTMVNAFTNRAKDIYE